MRATVTVGHKARKDIERGEPMGDAVVVGRADVPSTGGEKVSYLPPVSPHAAVDPRCVSLTRPDSYESGRYLNLRSSLEPKRPVGKGLVVAVTSPAAGDGKSLTAINLAGAFAQNPKFRVLVIDADLRRRSESLRRYLGVAAQSQLGLTDMICEDQRNFDDALLTVPGQPNLSVMLRGTRKVDAYEALASSRFGAFLQYVRGFYHHVIIDTAPVLPVPDHSAIARWADGFLMVVTAQRTPQSVLAEALRNVGQEKLMGIVLNRCEPLPQRYYGYYGSYGGEERRAGKRRQRR